MGETTISIPTRDGPMQGYLTAPGTPGRGPALVVLMEAFGVNAHIQDVCRRLAGEGYVALAPDLFHRAGAGLTFAYDDTSHALPALGTLTNETLEADVLAALAA